MTCAEVVWQHFLSGRPGLVSTAVQEDLKEVPEPEESEDEEISYSHQGVRRSRRLQSMRAVAVVTEPTSSVRTVQRKRQRVNSRRRSRLLVQEDTSTSASESD